MPQNFIECQRDHAHGRRGWLREAKRQLDRERAAKARPVPRSRHKRLKQAKRRLDEELAVECRANAAYEHYRSHARDSRGRRLGARPTPFKPPATPAGTINVTGPDSRLLKAPRGFMQGYNAQVVANENQTVIAAEITIDSPDFGHLEPMVKAAERELAGTGLRETPGVAVAMPATGTPSRCRTSSTAAPRCSFHPNRSSARPPGRDSRRSL
jgi:hypothetical protein